MHDIDRTFMETNDMETFEFQSEEIYGETSDEVFGEDEVERLAAELLSVSNEDELDHFLGSMLRKVGGAIGSAVRSPVGRALGGMLKGVVKKALPMAGAALGNMVLPGVGGAIGGKLASAAGSMFGLEVEGLSGEDQQFEVAKQFVRLAADATKSAAQAPTSSDPAGAARAALMQSAQRFAPGLLSGRNGPTGNSGRWIRRGSSIVLLNA